MHQPTSNFSQFLINCYIILQNKLQLFYNKIRLSVQRSYSVLLNPACHVSIHHYRVYKHFVIQGYKLFRHQCLPMNTVPEETKESKPQSSYGTIKIYDHTFEYQFPLFHHFILFYRRIPPKTTNF